MTKYVANALLATKISFINEMANLCERLRRRHQRRPPRHRPRPAHRLPVPVSRRRLRRQLLPQGRAGAGPPGPAASASSRCCSRRSMRSTSAQKHVLVAQDRAALRRRPGRQDDSPSGAWPSSRKTDDIREAPALALIDACSSAGPRSRVHDPEAMDNVRSDLRRQARPTATRRMDALEGADALAIVTEWGEFRNPDFDEMQPPHAPAGHLRRPQPLRPRHDAGARLHVLLHRPQPGESLVGCTVGCMKCTGRVAPKSSTVHCTALMHPTSASRLLSHRIPPPAHSVRAGTGPAATPDRTSRSCGGC